MCIDLITLCKLSSFGQALCGGWRELGENECFANLCYQFQRPNLPIFLPKSFFHSIEKLSLSFIWAMKNPRKRKEILQRLRSEGWLDLPHLRYYYYCKYSENSLLVTISKSRLLSKVHAFYHLFQLWWLRVTSSANPIVMSIFKNLENPDYILILGSYQFWPKCIR